MNKTEHTPASKRGRTKTFGRLLARYQSADRSYDQLRDQLTKEKLAIEAKLQKLKSPSWVEDMIKPIAEMMLLHLPGRRFDLLGPFGLCNEFSIHFHRIKRRGKDPYSEGNCLSITFVHDHETGLKLRDYSKNNGEYAPGTLGAANGMQYASVDIPVDADGAWFVRWMKSRNE